MSNQTVVELRRALEMSESENQSLRERVRVAEEQAAVDRQSRRDAWQFARTLLTSGDLRTICHRFFERVTCVATGP